MDTAYPEYNDIEQYISKDPRCFFEFAEYGNVNHEHTRLIYDTLNSDLSDDIIKSKIRDIGQEIHARGGMDAMR